MVLLGQHCVNSLNTSTLTSLIWSNWTHFHLPLNVVITPLQWRHNRRDGVSTHQPHHCLLDSLFRCRSNNTAKLRVTGLCAGTSPVTGDFPAQMASNSGILSIWWRHRACETLGNISCLLNNKMVGESDAFTLITYPFLNFNGATIEV